MSFWDRYRLLCLIGMGLVVCAVLFLLLHSPSVPLEAQIREDVVASIGDRLILVDDVKAAIDRRGGMRPDLLDKNVLLDEMISEEALLAEACAEGLDKDPEVIRSYRNLVIGRLRALRLEPKLGETAVSATEIEAYYRDNVAAFTKPAMVRLAILFLAAHSKSSAGKRSELHARLEEAKAKAADLGSTPGFGPLAISYSEDQASRYKGGDIGWLHADGRPSRWPSEVVSAGTASKNIGDLSGVIETEKGFYLVKLSGRRDAVTRPLADVKETIRHKLLLAKRRDIEEAFVQNARTAVPIEINRDVLDRIPVPSTQTGERQSEQDGPPSMPY